MSITKRILAPACLLPLLLIAPAAMAKVLPEAEIGIKIPLADPSTSRPMTVAYMPTVSRYYIADGGLAAIPGDPSGAASRSERCMRSAGSPASVGGIDSTTWVARRRSGGSVLPGDSPDSLA